MLQVQSYAVSLPFEYPFTISKGTKTHQPALLVSLGFGKLTGWGEAPAITYYDVTVPAMQEALARVRPVIERYSLTDPLRYWHFLHHLLPGNNFLIAALDIAGWDLFAQLRRQPLYQALRMQDPGFRTTDYTIGLDTADSMLEKMKAHPCMIYKIKLRAPEDIDRLEVLRGATDAPFRVDVNEGWNYEDTRKLLPQLKKLGVVLLEQPLPKGEWDAMKALKAESEIALFADEGCVAESDVARCADCFDGIVIKLTKCGGITPAVRMAADARARGMQVMLGSMNESTIGTSALVQMSSAADHLDIDGPLLLAHDYAGGLNWKKEGADAYSVAPASTPGLGIAMNADWQQWQQ